MKKNEEKEGERREKKQKKRKNELKKEHKYLFFSFFHQRHSFFNIFLKKNKNKPLTPLFLFSFEISIGI